jgi:triacylglycerol lipase
MTIKIQNFFFKYLKVVISETLSLIGIIILYPFKSLKLDLPAKLKGNKSNVLCVHGYLMNETGWSYFGRQLKKAGVGTVNRVCYPTLIKDIPENCRVLKSKIDEFKGKTGLDINILIGHSLGGLECLEYALQYASRDKIIYVVTMGTPLHGTRPAAHGYGPSARQMEIGSAYLKNLHERLGTASHIRLLAIYSNIDFIIQPIDSAQITGLSYAQNQEIDALGHLSFLFSKRAIQKILAFLKSFDAL